MEKFKLNPKRKILSSSWYNETFIGIKTTMKMEVRAFGKFRESGQEDFKTFVFWHIIRKNLYGNG